MTGQVETKGHDDAVTQAPSPAALDAKAGATKGGARIGLRAVLKRAVFGSAGSMVAAAILLLLCLIAVLGGPICAVLGIDPMQTDLLRRLGASSGAHWLGTDPLGRDVLARLIAGARVSMAIGLAGAVCAAFVGCVVGLVAGYKGGMTDRVLMRLTDTVLALPLLPLLIIVSAIDFTKIGVSAETAASPSFGLYKMVAIITVFAWPAAARLVRAGTLSARENLYVTAARALGAKEGQIMLRHVLPNVIAPLIVAATLAIGNIIILESSLSFLGLGIQPPTASWGNMLQGAEDYIWEQPWLAVWPGLAIFITVIAFNVLGDSLRRAYNPRSESGK